ncbi:MAG: hypothetical protein KC441_03725 [Anaerolineales bacterium]|nr:hypothetical protein [Anaerolineales bacterium]
MKQKRFLFTFLFLLLLVLAACNSSGDAEPALESNNGSSSDQVVDDGSADRVALDHCPEAVPGAQQLIAAAQGVCFLYPDIYDVMESDSGSLTLYVSSPMNTEAPLATVRTEAIDGRSVQEIVPDYPSEAELAAISFLTIELGGEQATVIDTLPGQDLNRRIFAQHDGRVLDIMIARIGPEYGAVGEQAEALYEMITSSLQFIAIEPEAPLLAGPECPEAPVGTTLFTNDEGGYCLLLPDGYAVDDSLTRDNGGTETAVYVDSLMDSTHPRLFIMVEGANGRTLEEITTAKQEEFAEFDVSYSFGIMMDGVPANQFNQLPGQDLSRALVLVKDGRLYTLTFAPDDPTAGDTYSDMQTLYNTVLNSFRFLRQS